MIWAFAVLGVLFIILFMVVLGLLRYGGSTTITMPQNAILQIDFDTSLSEIRSDSLLNDITGEQNASFYDLIKAIAAASADDRIKAIFAEISQSDLSLSQIEELRSQKSLYFFRKLWFVWRWYVGILFGQRL